MCNDKQRNALGIDMIRSLQAAVDTTDMHQCRVLILSSNQAKIFSAGHNLKELTTEKGAELHQAVFEENGLKLVSCSVEVSYALFIDI